MDIFKEFLDFLSNIGVLNFEHIKLLKVKSPTPVEESEILWTLTDFFHTLQINDFFQITTSLYQKFISGCDNISKDLVFLRSIVNNNNSEKKNQKSQKNTQSIQKSLKNNHEKLYSDSFHKEEFIKLKKETQMKELLKNCTFVPEINRNKGIISEKLNVPVFERLSKETNGKNKYSENQREIIEIQECTFRPQVLKYIIPNNSERDPKAFQRLYQNAENNRQSQKLKKQIIEEAEMSNFNFVPEINESSSRLINKKRAMSKETTFNRLYQESVEKKLKSNNEEDENKNEDNECTFKPETSFTENYQKKSKILQEAKNSNIYERLYQNKFSKGTPHNISNPEEKLKSDKKIKKKEETPIFNKLYNQRFDRNKKHEEITKEYLKEIGATFKPKINDVIIKRKNSLPNSSKSFIKEKGSKEINKSFSTQSLHLNSSKKEKHPKKFTNKFYEKDFKEKINEKISKNDIKPQNFVDESYKDKRLSNGYKKQNLVE